MSSDQTQHQSSEDQQKARQLSLEGAQPPAQIPGYQLKRYIGSGAFGEVWSATQLKTGRRVAVKFFTRRSKTDIQMLAQEVEKLVALTADARYVVQLLDVGFEAQPPYYVMDYIEQGSIEDLMKRGNTLPTAQALDLFKEISTGMMALHGKGILHCDLKPGNVLLDQDGKPRVADFGQSRMSTDETSALGTLFYMAPEQADLTAMPDARWDVYGLGALLFCMLTGKPPYHSEELSGKIESKKNMAERLTVYREALFNAPAPNEHRQVVGVDRSLAEIIDKCIASDPKKRFNSVQSLLLALRQRELAQARRPLMVLGLIGPLLLMGVVSLFGWWAFNQAVDRTNEAVKAKSIESNGFAARLAAQSAGEQLDEYYRVVTQLARDDEFEELFQAFLDDDLLKKIRPQLADPNQNADDGIEKNSELGELRDQLRKNQRCIDLHDPLHERMRNLEHDYPDAASWFVCDRYGNQVASVFRNPDNKTLGNNYAYRTYFTGDGDDLDKSSLSLPENEDEREDVLASRKIIGVDSDGNVTRKPNLSAVFPSEQSKTWKIAFSAPIIIDNQIEGIVAVTVDLGNLIELASNMIAQQAAGDESAPTDLQAQYVMLVDGRNHEHPGVILEHPLFNKVIEFKGALTDELATTSVDLDAAENFPMEFNDPVGKTHFGKQFNYGRQSMVSVVDVDVEKIPIQREVREDGSIEVAEREATGLFVLSVQDREHILADVQQLKSDLGKLAVLALLILIAVALGMWLFVNRMMQESRERLARAFSPSNNSAVSESRSFVEPLGAEISPSAPTPRPPTSRAND